MSDKKDLTIKQIKEKYELTDSDIAKMFDYKNRVAYANSSAKKRVEKAIEKLYSKFASK